VNHLKRIQLEFQNLKLFSLVCLTFPKFEFQKVILIVIV